MLAIDVDAPEQDEEEVIDLIAGIKEKDDDHDEVVSACAVAEAAEFQEATKEATTLLGGDNFRDKHTDDDRESGTDPVAAIVDAAVGKDLKAMTHANSKPQLAFTDVLLELARGQSPICLVQRSGSNAGSVCSSQERSTDP